MQLRVELSSAKRAGGPGVVVGAGPGCDTRVR
jgi:hypothetical protein